MSVWTEAVRAHLELTTARKRHAKYGNVYSARTVGRHVINGHRPLDLDQLDVVELELLGRGVVGAASTRAPNDP
jgi:hypothetical protein